MDINHFLKREQIERMRADAAISSDARTAHIGMADRYGALIAAHRIAGNKPALARAGNKPALASRRAAA